MHALNLLFCNYIAAHMRMGTNMCMGCPYAYGTAHMCMGHPIHVWDGPYTYGQKYAYGTEQLQLV